MRKVGLRPPRLHLALRTIRELFRFEMVPDPTRGHHTISQGLTENLGYLSLVTGLPCEGRGPRLLPAVQSPKR